MPDEPFRGTATEITDTDRLLIEQVWASIQRRDRWRSRLRRLACRVRALMGVRHWASPSRGHGKRPHPARRIARYD